MKGFIKSLEDARLQGGLIDYVINKDGSVGLYPYPSVKKIHLKFDFPETIKAIGNV